MKVVCFLDGRRSRGVQYSDEPPKDAALLYVEEWHDDERDFVKVVVVPCDSEARALPGWREHGDELLAMLFVIEPQTRFVPHEVESFDVERVFAAMDEPLSEDARIAELTAELERQRKLAALWKRLHWAVTENEFRSGSMESAGIGNEVLGRLTEIGEDPKHAAGDPGDGETVAPQEPLAGRVRNRIGHDGKLSISCTLTANGSMAYDVRWRRDYGTTLSDERYEHADSIDVALAKVLRWEDDADAEDGKRMAYAPQAGDGAEVV